MYDNLASIDITSLQEKVYQSVRLALLKGHFQPGDVMSIRKLAEALGTSPMPVREALKRLIAEKALVQTSGRQILVTPFDPQRHEEFIRIRMKLEGFAAERAAMVRDAGLVDRLEKFNLAMIESARQSKFEEALAANYDFHFEVYRAAGYPQLVEILESLWVRAGPYLTMLGNLKPVNAMKSFDNGHKAHARAIMAIANRDAKEAGRAIALDIRMATLYLREIYATQLAQSTARPINGDFYVRRRQPEDTEDAGRTFQPR